MPTAETPADAFRAFVERAHPHSWFLVADNLHTQLLALRTHYGSEKLMGASSNTHEVWDGTNRAAFLLGGFVLENAIKAFVVYENPTWIANGRLGRPLRSHSLTTLTSYTDAIPYKKTGRWVLAEFERGLESWARYPCPLSWDAYEEEQVLSDRLWKGYLRLTSAYGRRLVKLLSAEWRGPHGWRGRFDIRGEWLAPR